MLLVELLRVVFVAEPLGAALEPEPLEVKLPEVLLLGAALVPELEPLGVVLVLVLLGALLVPELELLEVVLEPPKLESLGVVRVPKPEVPRLELPELELLGAVLVPKLELPELEPFP